MGEEDSTRFARRMLTRLSQPDETTEKERDAIRSLLRKHEIKVQQNSEKIRQEHFPIILIASSKPLELLRHRVRQQQHVYPRPLRPFAFLHLRSPDLDGR